MSKTPNPDRLPPRPTPHATPDPLERYQAGWRTGKPIEDPEKIKRWGLVSAKPSEYLIVIRNGKIDRHRSGQGATLFKWPWHSIAIVPTTLQKIEFTADQITRERVGVTITGLAVYRIAEPELAYRVLNFTYGERAGEKLATTLREMFIGAARRLIANLTLDECLMKRKEAIAAFLMREIEPVVSGRGALDDTTDQGWGVVLDTIEIQDVHIQSEKVFADLQAPFRAELSARAELAELEREQGIAERKAEAMRRIAEADIHSQQETRAMRARSEAEAAEIEAAETLRAEQARARTAADELARREALARKRLEVEREIGLREAESAAAIDRRKEELSRERNLARMAADEEQRRTQAQLELSALAAEATLAEEKHQLESRRLEQGRQQQQFQQETESALRKSQLELEMNIRLREADMRRVEAEVEAIHQRALAEIEQLVNEGRVLRDLVNTGLPQIATAFRQNFGSIHYTQVGTNGAEGGPLGMVAAGFTQLLTVAKAFGIDPARFVSGPEEKVQSAATVSTAAEGETPAAPLRP